MNKMFAFFVLFGLNVLAQDSLSVGPSALNISSLRADSVVGKTDRDDFIVLRQNAVYHAKDSLISYANIQMGTLAQIDAFNPLKVILNYADFNTVVVLDNRLAEINRIDFNADGLYKNIATISAGSDSSFWLFNLDTQKLELFDYRNRATRVHTVPIPGKVIDQKSNYNFCWVLTHDTLYRFNYFGSMISKLPAMGFSKIVLWHNNPLLLKDNTLYLVTSKKTSFKSIVHFNVYIKDIFVRGETLYLYDGKYLHEYQLLTGRI